MKIVFDAAKDVANQRKHGLSLADAVHLDFTRAFVVVDDRRDYGEQRMQANGRIEGRLHVLAFTIRGDALRAISLRKANQREEKLYGK